MPPPLTEFQRAQLVWIAKDVYTAKKLLWTVGLVGVLVVLVVVCGLVGEVFQGGRGVIPFSLGDLLLHVNGLR